MWGVPEGPQLWASFSVEHSSIGVGRWEAAPVLGTRAHMASSVSGLGSWGPSCASSCEEDHLASSPTCLDTALPATWPKCQDRSQSLSACLTPEKGLLLACQGRLLGPGRQGTLGTLALTLALASLRLPLCNSLGIPKKFPPWTSAGLC